MREQILDGIRQAKATANLTPMTCPLADLDSEEMELIADAILVSLSQSPATTPPTVEILPEATPVVTVDATEIVAMLASTAIRQDDNDFHDGVVDGTVEVNVEDPYTTIVHDFLAAGDDRAEFRQFLFAIQPVFGVRVRSLRATEADPYPHPRFAVAGRQNSVRAFILIARTFHDLGSERAEALPQDERAAFWATVGNLAASTNRAQTQAAANEPLYAAATRHLNARFGVARTLARAEASAPGTPGHDNAVAVLADAATRL